MPPFPRGRRNTFDESAISVLADAADDVAVLTARGSWGRRLGLEVHGGLRLAMAEHPAALVLDLSGMADPHAASLAAWVNARHVGQAMDPAVEVAVCVRDDTALADRLRRLVDVRYLPVFDTVAEARAAVRRNLPLTDELRLALRPELESCSLARVTVTDACAAWRVPDLMHRGRLVISELVANAAQHARTPMAASVVRRARGLRVAVYDGDPRMPTVLPLEPPPSAGGPPARPLYPERGQGLRVVDAAATSWGAMPTAGGKMVWATLYPRREHGGRNLGFAGF